jgi:hypothetical protein
MSGTYAPLSAEQVEILVRQGCTVEGSDWSCVSVAEGFLADRVRQVHFNGQVRIGRLDGPCPAAAGAPAGIEHATLSDCDVGDHVRISRIGTRLANYHLGDGACIENVGLLEATPGGTFGNGVEVEAVNEGGGREVCLFNELSSQFAHLMCLHRHRPKFQQALAAMAKSAAAGGQGSHGTIGAGALIQSVTEMINVHVGPAAVIQAAVSLVEGTILSDPEARTVVGAGVQAQDFIVAEGSEVTTDALLRKTYVGQGCQIGRQFSAENCLFFANCEGFHGEACSVFAGPYSVTHHKSTLLIAGMLSFYNAGSGTNQSNHMYKLGPNHEGKLERGCKTGSFSYMMWPCRVGPFSLVLGKHSRAFDTADFPFSSLDATPDGRCALIPGLLLTTVGTVRDGAKWPRRDRRHGAWKRDRISFDVLSPLTVGRMLRGSAILEKLQKSTDKSVDTVVVQGAEIKRVILRTGQKYYRRGINLYLAEKIVHRVKTAMKRADVTLRQALASSPEAVYSEDWVDVGGQLMPQQRLTKLYEDVESGLISDVESLEARLDQIQAAYAEDEWLWVRTTYQRKTGIDFDQCSIDDLKAVAENLLKTRTEFLQLILIDASKEFEDQAQIGFGVESDCRLSDFQAVRGDLDANEFVQSLRNEIAALEPSMREFQTQLDRWS